MPRYSYHGYKAGICYRTEVGCKIYARKEKGVLIVRDSAGYYWRLDQTRMYPDEKIVSVRRNDKWEEMKDE